MKTKEFAQLIQDGIKPIVTFTKPIKDCETYAEAGMRAKVIGVQFDHDDVIKLTVDYSAYDEFNKQYESHNYYDKNGDPVLNAREAGLYKQVDTIYLMADQEVPFTIEDSERLKLYELYKRDSKGLSYIQWLEDFVLQLTK